jgi:stalled ribosome alternative rescue factor ArfA
VAKELEDGNGKGCEERKEDYKGEGEWVTWEQKKETRE